MKPRIIVVGAAIVKNGKLLALRRAYGEESVNHLYEFVGGKVEKNETHEEALIRECKEELDLEIEVGDLLGTIEYDYPQANVTLSVYFVKPLSDYTLRVHEEENWIDCDKLDASEWAPADKSFLGTLISGYSTIRPAESEQDFEIISEIASSVMHEMFDESVPEGQIDYMLKRELTPEIIAENIREREYTYKLVYLNGEVAGFAAYCPAKYYDPSYTEGTFLSKVYMYKFARGKRLLFKLLSSMPRPVYLKVKKDNVNAINIYKHYDFKILESLKTDIGEGYFMDDFLMVLGK